MDKNLLALALKATAINELKIKSERKLKNNKMVIYKEDGSIVYKIKDSMHGQTFANITNKLADKIKEFKNSNEQCLRI
jgi:hypothetical protein